MMPWLEVAVDGWIFRSPRFLGTPAGTAWGCPGLSPVRLAA